MRNPVKQIRKIVNSPIHSIIDVLAIVMFTGGLYIISPVWNPSDSPYLQAGVNLYGVYVLGIIYVILSLITFTAVFRENNKWAKRGTFGMFLFFIFTALIRVLNGGLVPIVWIAYLALGLITGICHLALEDEDARISSS